MENRENHIEKQSQRVILWVLCELGSTLNIHLWKYSIAINSVRSRMFNINLEQGTRPYGEIDTSNAHTTNTHLQNATARHVPNVVSIDDVIL